MAVFKASKERKRKSPDPVGRGKPIIPSVAIEGGYSRKMNQLANSMRADYREKLHEVMREKMVKEHYAKDASVTSAFTSTLKGLKTRWSSIFEGFARVMAPEFVEDAAKAASDTTLFSLRAAGLKQPRAEYNESISNLLQSSKDYNHTLITGLCEEAHEKVYSAVMLSLTSPDPAQQGMSGIRNALTEMGVFTENRIKLITKDQTSKVYSSVSTSRMKENGVTKFEWLHTSAGKVPRHSHVEKDGVVFDIDDKRLWEGPKADQGPPGWAINCRCRAVPIIGWMEDDD